MQRFSEKNAEEEMMPGFQREWLSIVHKFGNI